MPHIAELSAMAEGLSVDERAARIVQSVYGFISLHVSIAELLVFPDSYEALRDTLLETGAHFGEPPPPEVANSASYVHQAFVPGTYEDLREVIMSGFTACLQDVTKGDYSSEYTLTKAVEAALPEDEYDFVSECRKSWISWSAGAVFILETVGLRGATGPEYIGDLMETLSNLEGT